MFRLTGRYHGKHVENIEIIIMTCTTFSLLEVLRDSWTYRWAVLSVSSYLCLQTLYNLTDKQIQATWTGEHEPVANYTLHNFTYLYDIL